MLTQGTLLSYISLKTRGNSLIPAQNEEEEENKNGYVSIKGSME